MIPESERLIKEKNEWGDYKVTGLQITQLEKDQALVDLNKSVSFFGLLSLTIHSHQKMRRLAQPLKKLKRRRRERKKRKRRKKKREVIISTNFRKYQRL